MLVYLFVYLFVLFIYLFVLCLFICLFVRLKLPKLLILILHFLVLLIVCAAIFGGGVIPAREKMTKLTDPNLVKPLLSSIATQHLIIAALLIVMLSLISWSDQMIFEKELKKQMKANKQG